MTEPLPTRDFSGAELFREFVRKHRLAAETLTELQLAEAFRQSIASGDFVRYVTVDGGQTVEYVPYRELERVRTLYCELIGAVSAKYEGESRHETALRYIRERENSAEKHSAPARPAGEAGI